MFHQILVDKLKFISFKDNARKLISGIYHTEANKSILTIRYLTSSKLQDVPQGTLLVPLLFDIYVKKLTNCFSKECKIIQYADDNLVYSANQMPDIAIESLKICLEILESYFRSNQLTLNASKTEFMRFTTPELTVSNNHLIVAGSNIKLKNEVKYLGIIINNRLTFET